jgi:hypothetical protein
MSLAKYLSLLEKKCLFFARADTLEDKFEGSYTLGNMKLRKTFAKEISLPEDKLTKFYRILPKAVFISSWHLNDVESAALWNLYTNGHGIAILSTVDRFKKALSPAEEEIHIGKIKYVKYHKGDYYINVSNVFNPFLHKRKSYAHEKELRAIAAKIPEALNFWDENPKYAFKKTGLPKGLEVKINVNSLIEKVYVPPRSEEWFRKLAISITRKYGLKKEIKRSDLEKDPLY